MPNLQTLASSTYQILFKSNGDSGWRNPEVESQAPIGRFARYSWWEEAPNLGNKKEKFCISPDLIKYLKEKKDFNSLVVHFFTMYRFEYYLKKKKRNVTPFGELRLNLQWLTLYAVDLLPKK